MKPTVINIPKRSQGQWLHHCKFHKQSHLKRYLGLSQYQHQSRTQLSKHNIQIQMTSIHYKLLKPLNKYYYAQSLTVSMILKLVHKYSMYNQIHEYRLVIILKVLFYYYFEPTRPDWLSNVKSSLHSVLCRCYHCPI